MPRVAITVPGKKSQPYRFQLDRDKVTIGRGKDCDILIDDPSVSSLHCTMERVDGGYVLRDQQSTNGLKLDEEEMSVIDLRNDIDVFVGDAEFEYTLSDEELDELDDEDFVPHAKKAGQKESPKKQKKDLDEEEDDDFDEEDEAPRKKRKKAKVITTPARPAPAAAAPALASSKDTGSGFLTIATFACGILAFWGGMDASYRSGQKDLERKGDVTLLGDIRNGVPALPAPKEEEEE